MRHIKIFKTRRGTLKIILFLINKYAERRKATGLYKTAKANKLDKTW